MSAFVKPSIAFLLGVLMVLATLFGALGINDTELEAINNTVSPPIIEQIKTTETNIQTKIDGINTTNNHYEYNLSGNFTVVLTEDQLEELIEEFTSSIIINKNFSCSQQNINLTSVESIVDNKVDEGFADQQAYFQNTYLPSEAEIDALRNQKQQTESELSICNNRLEGLRITSNATLALEKERTANAENAESVAYWFVLALAVLVVALILTKPEVRKFFKRGV